jgi:sugar lactone lactonase YvrE
LPPSLDKPESARTATNAPDPARTTDARSSRSTLPLESALLLYNAVDLAAPDGIAFSPDQAMLFVTGAETRFSWSFQIAADGTLINGEPFYRLEIPETAKPLGIQICEANGRVATLLNSPHAATITSLAFAGKNLDWLYVAAGNQLFRQAPKPPLYTPSGALS